MALVLWSGGCDSTLVLHNLLKGESPPDGCGVKALSVIHPQVNAHKQQKAARKVLAAKLEARGLRFQRGTLRYKQDGDLFSVPGNSLNQPQLWLLAAASFLEEKEDLYAGWIRGDDAWQHAHQVRAAFDAIQAVSGKTGKLLTPLDGMRKSEVLRELRLLKLADDCWYCEGCTDADTTPCGWCVSCDVHRTAEWQLDRPGDKMPIGETLYCPKYETKAPVEVDEKAESTTLGPHNLRPAKRKRRA